MRAAHLPLLPRNESHVDVKLDGFRTAARIEPRSTSDPIPGGEWNVAGGGMQTLGLAGRWQVIALQRHER